MIPAPSAAALEPAPLASVTCRSFTSNVDDWIAVNTPCTVKLPVIVASPPTVKFLAIPTPPAVIIAPVVVLVLCVSSVDLNRAPTVILPATPTPPVTTNAPVVVVVDTVVLLTLTSLVKVVTSWVNNATLSASTLTTILPLAPVS